MKDTLKDRAVKIAEEVIGNDICDEIGLKATLKILKAIERAIVESERIVTPANLDEIVKGK
jgi:hypothetical protein|tara:strand:+ start:383 stop:565 length:183 start_codon:yes stop_codon:yes gene_type:complete